MTNKLKLTLKLNPSFFQYLVAAFARFLACCVVFSTLAKANCQESSGKFNQQRLAPENIPGTIILSRFNIIGNRVIPEARLKQLLQPYLFRPVTFVELLKVQQAITKLYVERGYFTSGAYIPPQTINNRTLKIEIIEGKVEEIKISGLKRLRLEYVRSRLAIATQAPLNQDKLLNALQQLQLNPLIRSISAELSQGINPGESFLEVKIAEADTFSSELNLNNYRTPSVGSISRQVSLSEGNLLGFGDRFNISYVNTDGSDSLEDLSYVIPLGAYNSEVRLAYSLSNNRIISEPFQDLDLASENRYYEATYRQPLYQTPQQDITIGVTFSRQNSQLLLMDRGFPSLTRGSDNQGKTQISALRLFQEYSDRSDSHVFAVRSQFSIGIDAFDATINSNDVPDSKFLIWRGQAQYLKMLAPRTTILLRSDLQLADRPLVSLEQFSSGGALSVRGYSQERVLGDNGFFFSAELRNTIWQITKQDLTLELNPFFDFGQVWNSDNLPLELNTLASLGLGLQLAVGETLATRIDWGFPLIDDDSAGNSLQESGVYFSVRFKPF